MEPKKYIEHLVRRGLTRTQARLKVQRWLDQGKVHFDRNMFLRVGNLFSK
jgi:hypothetical protein